MNKASGWPGDLHAGRVSRDPYPSVPTRDTRGLALQPHVVGVTSYVPNRRLDNYQYRNVAQVSFLSCADSSAYDCADGVSVTVVGVHDFKAGDVVRFSGALGADRADFAGEFFVKSAAANRKSFVPVREDDTNGGSWREFGLLGKDYDVASALRAANRFHFDPSNRAFYYGGRVLRSVPSTPEHLR